MTNVIAKLEALHNRALARSQVQRPSSNRKPHIRVHANQSGVEIEALIRKALNIVAVGQKAEGIGWDKSAPRHHISGAICPHCRGTGAYSFHTDASRLEKCYRCDGKGRLDHCDLDYLNKRMAGAGSVCWVRSASAA